MTYTLLPNSGQSLGQTRAQIRTNFDLLQQDLDKNHVSINDADRGKHKFVELKSQASLPAGLTTGEYTLYAKSVSVGPAVQLFGSRSDSGVEVQFTQDLSNAIPANTLNNGGTFLPGEGTLGALILRWGFVSQGPNFTDLQEGDVNFTPNFPNACLNVFVTMGSSLTPTAMAMVNVQTKAANKFHWRFITDGSTSYNLFYWMAIGY